MPMPKKPVGPFWTNIGPKPAPKTRPGGPMCTRWHCRRDGFLRTPSQGQRTTRCHHKCRPGLPRTKPRTRSPLAPSSASASPPGMHQPNLLYCIVSVRRDTPCVDGVMWHTRRPYKNADSDVGLGGGMTNRKRRSAVWVGWGFHGIATPSPQR